MTKDILIAVVAFPNDATGKCVSRQLFVIEEAGNKINFYSISSIAKKENF